MRSQLTHFLGALSGQPLAVERGYLNAFHAMIRRRGLEGIGLSGAEIHAEMSAAMPRPARQVEGGRNVAVIPIVGAISNRSHSMGVGAQEIGRALDLAVSDARADVIVMDMDSPGGTVTYVPELAAKILAARAVKPVIAHANGMVASAAYWLGSQATEVVASPSSMIGSIGVILLHEDESKWLENEGIVVTEIAAGKYKTEGAPWRPLDAEAEEFMTSLVAMYYDWFVRDVATGRGDTPANVRGGYGEGRVLGAKDAKAAGLIDRIETLDETIARYSAGKPSRKGMRADAEAESRKRARMRQA